MTAMKWRKEPPTIGLPGYFWYRDEDVSAMPVFVTSDGRVKGGIENVGPMFLSSDVEMLAGYGEWCPIPLPEEA